MTRQDSYMQNRSSQVVRGGHQVEIIAKPTGSAFFSLARSVRIITAETASSRVATYLGTPVVSDVVYEVPPNCRGCITFEQQGTLIIWGEHCSVEIVPSGLSLQRLSNISHILQAMRWKASEKLQKAVHRLQSVVPGEGASRVPLSEASRVFYTTWATRLNAATIHKDFQADTDSVDPSFVGFAETASQFLRHPDLEIPRVLVMGVGSYAVAQYLCIRALDNAAEPIYVELDPATSLTHNQSAASLPLFTFAPGTLGFVGTSVGAVVNPCYRLSAYHDRRGGLAALASGRAACGSTIESPQSCLAVMRSILADEGGYEPVTSLSCSSFELSSDNKRGGLQASGAFSSPDSPCAAGYGIETVRNTGLPPAIYDGRVCYYVGAGSAPLGCRPADHLVYRHCATAVAGALMVQNCFRLERSLVDHNIALARPQLQVSTAVDTSQYSDSAKSLRTVASGLIVHGPRFVSDADHAQCIKAGTTTRELAIASIGDILDQFSINVVIICCDNAESEGVGYGAWLFQCISAVLAARSTMHSVHVMMSHDPFCIAPRFTSLSSLAGQYCTAYWEHYFFGMPLTRLLNEQRTTTSGFGSGATESRLLAYVQVALASSVLRPCVVEVPYCLLRMSQYAVEKLEGLDGEQVSLKLQTGGPASACQEGLILAVILTERDDWNETTFGSKDVPKDEILIDNAKWFPVRFFTSILAIHSVKQVSNSTAVISPHSSTAASNAASCADTDVPILDTAATVSLLVPFQVSQKAVIGILRKAVLVVGTDTLLNSLL